MSISRSGLTPLGGWLLLAAVIFLATTSPQALAAETRPPNIILILADDLGYGDLGCYGQQRIQTPQLDKMAREGLRFTDFYAGSTVCAPARCTLMTGYHTGHSLIRGNGQGNLRPNDVTLPKVLKLAGFHTGHFGKWGLGSEGSAGVPTKQGLDEFIGYLDHVHAHNYYPAFLLRNEERFSLENEVPGEQKSGAGVATKRVTYTPDLFTEEALAFVERNQAHPFFLYLAVTIPHANNEAKAKGMEVPELGQYAQLDWPEPQKAHAAMISRLDADVGRLLAKIKELKLDENTLVLFTSDNGPHAEGGCDPKFNNSSGGLNGQKRSLTDGGIRVPLLARWPGKIEAGKTTGLISFHGDLLPTLAELTNSTAAVPADLDGVSLLPTLRGNAASQKQHDYLYWAFFEQGGAQAIRQENWKGVQQPIKGPLRLYDLSTDPGEQYNVADKHPDIAEKLADQMKAAFKPSEDWKFPAPIGDWRGSVK